MVIVRTNKYRLYPSAVQKSMLFEMFNSFRLVFNFSLGLIQDKHWGVYEVKNGKNKGNTVPRIPSQTELIGFSTEIKALKPFLNRLPNDFIQASLTNLYTSTKGFYRGGRFPKFKSRKLDNSGINMYAGSRVKIESEYIILPKAKDTPYSKEDLKIKFKKHKTNHDISKITGYTIKKDNLDNYWIAITYKIEVQDLKITKGKQVGIDLGLKELVITSDGETIENHNLTKKYARKLKLEQRKLSRKKKGSKNRSKQRRKVGKVHTKIKNCRNDYNHKVSSKLVNLYDFIGIETLNVKGMIKNKRLSKAIANVSWFSLVSYLDYKANEKQVSLVKIDTWYPSSKTCNVCGTVKDTLSLSERTYICECGYKEDRDVNAARNILNESLRQARKE